MCLFSLYFDISSIHSAKTKVKKSLARSVWDPSWRSTNQLAKHGGAFIKSRSCAILTWCSRFQFSLTQDTWTQYLRTYWRKHDLVICRHCLWINWKLETLPPKKKQIQKSTSWGFPRSAFLKMAWKCWRAPRVVISSACCWPPKRRTWRNRWPRRRPPSLGRWTPWDVTS